MNVVVRASSLSGWPDCERRSAAKLFRADVVAAGFDLRELSSNIGAAVGTGVHAGAAHSLREKMQSGSLGPASAAEDAAITVLREEVHKGLIWDDDTPTPNDAERVARRLLATYRDQVAPTLHPIAVEERLEADAGEGLVLSGQADVLARVILQVQEAEEAITDLKTGKVRSSYKPQLGAYSLLMKSHGYPVKRLLEDWVQRAPMRRPQPDARRFEHAIGPAEVAAVQTLGRMQKTIIDFRTTGEPWAFLANPSSKLCTSKFCPAHGTKFCVEWRDDTSVSLAPNGVSQ